MESSIRCNLKLEEWHPDSKRIDHIMQQATLARSAITWESTISMRRPCGSGNAVTACVVTNEKRITPQVKNNEQPKAADRAHTKIELAISTLSDCACFTWREKRENHISMSFLFWSSLTVRCVGPKFVWTPHCGESQLKEHCFWAAV